MQQRGQGVSVITFDPNQFSTTEKRAIEEAASERGLLVEFGTAESGQEFAIIRCPRWTTFGVIKDDGCWHAYNEKGQGLSLRTNPTDLVKLISSW